MALAWLLLVVGAMLTGFSADRYSDAGAEGEQLQRQVDRLQRKAKVGAMASRKGDRQKSAVAARPDAAPFPWDGALTEIELASERSIALLTLDTDAKARRTRLGAEARNVDEALAFVTRLRDSPLVGSAFLLSHEAKRDSPVPVVFFTAQVEWSVE